MSRLIFLCLALSLPLPSLAAVEPLNAEPPATLEQEALKAGDAISRGVKKTAEAIDITLAGKKYTQKENPSSVTLSESLNHLEGGINKLSTDFSLNLRLINLERRWQLRFNSYDEERESHDLTQSRVRPRPRERDYGAGLIFFEKLGRIKTSFLPRLQLKNPLDMRYTLRFESDANVDFLKLTPRLDLYADPTRGTGEYFSLDFRAKLNQRTSLALQNSEDYEERQNLFTTQHEISLDYALTESQSVGSAVDTSSLSRPSFHLANATYSVSYGQQIYPERLRWSFTPYMSFSKADAFKGKAGVSADIELTF